ncbi:MAG: SufD family Fe-S cluster assembly protein [Bacteroidales bacterium]|nr:SufD family Fe-S cluster assembly protein [Bacteroidales bacterium]
MILFSGSGIIASGDSLHQEIRLDAGQAMDLVLVALGGGQAVFDVEIAGAGADINLRGLYLCGGNDRLDIKVNMRHSVGESRSNQLFRGIMTGEARARFDGRIVVAPDAQKTEAYQINQNLQLSDDAVVETLPQLEIYADDVKCSHGATVGNLNLDEQFYMRSRGVSLEEARRLQMISFLAPVMEGLPEDVKEQVYAAIR